MDTAGLVVAVLALALAIWALLRSEDAHKLAVRTEHRATERNSVTWSLGLDRSGRLTITNEGLDDALDVTITAGIEGRSWTAERDVVTSGETVELVAEYVDHRPRVLQFPLRGSMAVIWKTPAGRWREHRDDSVLL